VHSVVFLSERWRVTLRVNSRGAIEGIHNIESCWWCDCYGEFFIESTRDLNFYPWYDKRLNTFSVERSLSYHNILRFRVLQVFYSPVLHICLLELVYVVQFPRILIHKIRKYDWIAGLFCFVIDVLFISFFPREWHNTCRTG
jgi:hypothetical protein